ncbi:MAG: hypothetical protein HKL80_09995 [Acidimicrobiales bacterium]|nr:hypothetical protein [Acidimicrobiales bacterium]
MTTAQDAISGSNGSAAGWKPAAGFTHVGERYILGFGDDFFAIYDKLERRDTPTEPVQSFPRTQEGWNDAWRLFASWEPRSHQVQLSRARRVETPAAPTALAPNPSGYRNTLSQPGNPGLRVATGRISGNPGPAFTLKQSHPGRSSVFRRPQGSAGKVKKPAVAQHNSNTMSQATASHQNYAPQPVVPSPIKTSPNPFSAMVASLKHSLHGLKKSNSVSSNFRNQSTVINSKTLAAKLQVQGNFPIPQAGSVHVANQQFARSGNHAPTSPLIQVPPDRTGRGSRFSGTSSTVFGASKPGGFAGGSVQHPSVSKSMSPVLFSRVGARRKFELWSSKPAVIVVILAVLAVIAGISYLASDSGPSALSMFTSKATPICGALSRADALQVKPSAALNASPATVANALNTRSVLENTAYTSLAQITPASLSASLNPIWDYASTVELQQRQLATSITQGNLVSVMTLTTSLTQASTQLNSALVAQGLSSCILPPLAG